MLNKLQNEGLRDEWAADYALQCALQLQRRGWSLDAIAGRMGIGRTILQSRLAWLQKRHPVTTGEHDCAKPVAFVFPPIAEADLPLAEEHCFSPENERRHYRRMANIERAIAADPDISPTYRALLLLLAEWFDRRAGRSRRPGVAELRATVEELKGDLADEPRRGRSAEVRISKTSLSRSGPARRR